MRPRGRRRRRVRGMVVGLGAALGTAITFVVALAGAVLLHLDAPATRRLVAAQVNAVLEERYEGDVRIERIARLGLDGVEGVSLRVEDAHGIPVLHADGVKVALDGLRAARSALSRSGDVVVPIDEASIDHVEAVLDSDPAGRLRIAGAFADRSPVATAPAPPAARGLRVEMPRIALKHAWVHGRPPGAPALDAELTDLVARAHVEPGVTRAQLEHVDLVTRGLPRSVDPRGRIRAQVRLPSETGRPMSVEGAFDGTIAGIRTVAELGIDGDELRAVVDGRDPAGQGMRAMFGEVGIHEEVTFHAEAHGVLPRVAGKAHVTLARSTVDVDASVDASEGTKARAILAVRHVDARTLFPPAPESDVGLDARVSLAVAESGELDGDFVVETLPGTAGGERLPIVKLRGELTKRTAHVTGVVLDARANADFEAQLTEVGADRIVEAHLDMKVSDLSALPVAPAPMKGHASLVAHGRSNLGASTIDAEARVRGGAVRYGAHGVDDVRILATARGPLDRPSIDIGAHAGGISMGRHRIDAADVRARVQPGRVLIVDGPHVDLVNDGRLVSASASRVEIAERRVSVEGAVVTGLGEPIHADFARHADVTRVKVDAPAIDLHRVALVAGRAEAVRGGYLTLTGDLVLRPASMAGGLHARVDALSASALDDAGMTVDVTFAGQAIELQARGELASAGRFELATSQLVIAGNPMEVGSWRRARGRAKLDVNVDMGKVATVVPRDWMPVRDLRGRLVVTGAVRRDSGDVLPASSVHAHTRGLAIEGRGPDAERPYELPWRSEGLDLSVDARVDGPSGHTELAFHAVDGNGTLVGFDAKSDVPYQAVAADPTHAMALLGRAPVRARLVVPRRSLSELPSFLRTSAASGVVEAELDVAGTVTEPKIDLVAHARDLRPASLPVGLASDADLSFGYDGQSVVVAAKVRAEQHEVLDLGAHVDLLARDLVAGHGDALPWKGSARMVLTRLPLALAGAVAGGHMGGHVSGVAALDDLHGDPKLQAKLVVDRPAVEDVEYESATVAVDARAGEIVASARIDQPDGYLDLRGSAGLRWGAELTPSLDPGAPLEARLAARSFRAAAFLPLVRGPVNRLDGRIDADATVRFDHDRKDLAMEGRATLREGVVQLAALGQELRKVSADLTFQPDGVIRIDDVSLRGVSGGEARASAMVRTRGLAFEAATAQLRIPKGRALDFMLQGQALGAISGDVNVTAAAAGDGRTIDATVDVPTFEIVLPQKLRTGVQELGRNEKVRVGVFLDPRTFVELRRGAGALEPPPATEPSSTAFEIDVRIRELSIVQGTMARLVLAGSPHVRIDDETTVSGRVDVKRGLVDVQGKRFEIERGTVTFQPADASNPVVVGTAAWTSPTGSKIYADFVGPVRSGKATLRSEPPLPRNEILAIILFGTADGANATPLAPAPATDGRMKAAVGVGGGFAARGVTEALDDLTRVQATARIDTSRARNPAPEVEVQIARRLSIAFQHVLGTPPIFAPDKNLATIDWRVRGNWSLETTFGDRGKLRADAIWQKRY